MLRTGEEILADIDATLDQLIQYADAAHKVSLSDLEVEALQKTQESLLARLIHMEELFEKKNQPTQEASMENVQQKIARYSRLNAELIDGVVGKFARTSNARLKKRKATK